jgi:hypothetical protein
MPGHPRSDATSLALHAEVARRLRADPALVRVARARVDRWDAHPFYTAAWTALLDGPLDTLCELLVSDDERARDLRQATPFAGVVDNATRMRIWREVNR